MRIFLVSGFLALLFAPALRAERACSQMDLEAAVQRAKAVQTELLTYKITDEIDEGVPAPLQAQIRAFKESLAALADTALQCAPEDANPKPIETTLAKLLDANKPVINEVYDPKKPPQLDHIYGDEIDVKVSAPANLPQVLLARIRMRLRRNAIGLRAPPWPLATNAALAERQLRSDLRRLRRLLLVSGCATKRLGQLADCRRPRSSLVHIPMERFRPRSHPAINR